MNVQHDDASRASLGEEVGGELGGDGLAPGRPPIGAGVSVVRDDARDGAAGRAAARVDHDEELHEIIVDVWRARGLDQEHVAAADGLFDLDVHLAVGELLDDGGAEVHAEVVGDLLLK